MLRSSLEECFCAQLDVARGSVIRSMEFGTETLLFPGSLPFMLAMFRRCYLQDCLIYCMLRYILYAALDFFALRVRAFLAV